MSDAGPIAFAGQAFSDALARIHARAFPPPERWDEAAIRTLLATPGCFGLIHPAGGMLIARAIGGEAEILTLGVAPEARRQWVGTALVTRALQEAADLGASSMFLEVSSGNDAGQGLYRRLGFEIVGRRRRYYAAGDDALVMKFTLAAPGEAAAG